MGGRIQTIQKFELGPGDYLADGKYQILERMGGGWEGEVFKIREYGTGIARAAKLFYPHRNKGQRTSRTYARKLHRVRNCDTVIRYHTEEQLDYLGATVTALISEFVDGELLSEFVARQPGKRLAPYPAVHLLYALTLALESIHEQREYHGDLHIDNVIVKRFGLGFDLKLVDMHYWSGSQRENVEFDLVSLIRILYDVTGGSRHYARQCANIKALCCGLKKTLILRKFRTATHLRRHLEQLEW